MKLRGVVIVAKVNVGGVTVASITSAVMYNYTHLGAAVNACLITVLLIIPHRLGGRFVVKDHSYYSRGYEHLTQEVLSRLHWHAVNVNCRLG